MLDPRDPNNEIHLVLTPFEAAAALRAFYHAEPYVHGALRPIIQALQSSGIQAATFAEILHNTLEPSDA